MMLANHGLTARGLMLCCLFIFLTACANQEQDKADADNGGGFSAALPIALAAALPDIKGELKVVVIVDDGKATRAEYELENVVVTGATFTGTFKAKLTPGFHTFDLKFYIVGTDYDPSEGQGFLVGESVGHVERSIKAGANSVDMTGLNVDTEIDDDQDSISNLMELRLQTNPASKLELPQFNVFGFSPADASINVPANTVVSVEFDEAVDFSTVNSDSFVVTEGGSAVSGALGFTQETDAVKAKVSFTANGGFRFGTEFTVRLNDTIRAVSGRALIAKEFKFTTVNVSSVVTLTGVQQGYESILDAGSAARFVINGLVSGNVYIVTLNNLQQDLSLSMYSSSSFSAADRVCSSEQIGTAAERCVVTADVDSSIYLQVGSSLAEERSSFLVNMVTVTSLKGVSGTLADSVPVAGESLYVISGLTKGDTLVELQRPSGDADLFVYSDDAFSDLLCSSERKGYYSFGARVSNDGCIAAVGDSGNLFVKVLGFASEINLAGPVDYTAAWGAPVVVQLDALTDVWPHTGAMDRVIKYFHISGLEPGEYVLDFYFRTGIRVGGPRIYLYSGPRYDDASATCRNLGSARCVANVPTSGDLYFALDGWLDDVGDLAQTPYEISTHAVMDLTGLLPYSFTGDGAYHYFKLSGLDVNQEYAVVVNNDAVGAPGSTNYNVLLGSVYNEPTLSEVPCSNSSTNACDINNHGDVPNDSGELYFYTSTSSSYVDAPIMISAGLFLNADDFGVPKSLPASSTRNFVIESINNRVVRLFDMSKDLDLEVFYSTLATPDCMSNQSIGNASQVLEDYCSIDYKISGDKTYLVRVNDPSNDNAAWDFSIDWTYYNHWNRAFGDKGPAVANSGNRFDGKVYVDIPNQFVELIALDPDTSYALTVAGIAGDGSVAAGAPLAIKAYNGPVVAGAEDCSASADAVCTVTSDPNGVVRVELRATAAIASDLPYAMQLVRDPPLTTNLDWSAASGGVGPLTVSGQAIGPLRSDYYKITGLDAGATYDISVSNITSDVDLYVYQDATFTTFKAQNCAGTTASYSDQAGTTSEACIGLVPIQENGGNVLYLRVFGYSRTVDANYDLAVSVTPLI